MNADEDSANHGLKPVPPSVHKRVNTQECVRHKGDVPSVLPPQEILAQDGASCQRLAESQNGQRQHGSQCQ